MTVSAESKVGGLSEFSALMADSVDCLSLPDIMPGILGFGSTVIAFLVVQDLKEISVSLLAIPVLDARTVSDTGSFRRCCSHSQRT